MTNQIISEENLRLLATGQGLFETILWKDNCLWFFERHERRLRRSLGHFKANYRGMDLRELITDMIRIHARSETLRVKLIVLFPFNDAAKELKEENVLIQIYPESAKSDSISLKSMLSPFNPQYELLVHKTINYGSRFRMQSLARQASFEDALYVDAHGFISESSVANFFAIKKDGIITPPGAGILPGIIREILLERLNVREEPINISQLADLEGAFLTNSIRELHFVNKIDSINFKIFPEQYRLLMVEWAKIRNEYCGGKYL